MEESEVSIPFGTKSLPAVVTGSPSSIQGVVLNHGAGGDLSHPQLAFLSRILSQEGILVLRFTCKAINIGYRVKAFQCAVEHLLNNYPVEEVIVGGRSMGARASVMFASTDPFQPQLVGVLCLAYPLNAQGKPPSEDRKAPLLALRLPLLMVAGSKDPLCRREELQPILEVVKCKVCVEWRDGCGHELENKESQFKYLAPSIVQWCKDCFMKEC